jgi:hypothetical protein
LTGSHRNHELLQLFEILRRLLMVT